MFIISLDYLTFAIIKVHQLSIYQILFLSANELWNERESTNTRKLVEYASEKVPRCQWAPNGRRPIPLGSSFPHHAAGPLDGENSRASSQFSLRHVASAFIRFVCLFFKTHVLFIRLFSHKNIEFSILNFSQIKNWKVWYGNLFIAVTFVNEIILMDFECWCFICKEELLCVLCLCHDFYQWVFSMYLLDYLSAGCTNCCKR